jgi:hypothetical protein
MSKTAGRFASLLITLGLVAFFVGIFGGPRSFLFVGIAMIVASFVGYFVEELGSRRA